ncbi:hypothetical protein GB937_010672 [Aspergillus fischeri]|nr:hypothetical protein GB937_010672 [Aspergillus fischeri]
MKYHRDDYHRQHAPVSGEVIEARNIRDQSQGQFYGIEAPDEAGYQWCQTRGVIAIQTQNYGKVAVLPIGMAQVSSVKLTVNVSDQVEKSDNIAYFQFGGSGVCIVFEKRIKWRPDL